MLKGISSRWPGRFGIQIEAPSRQLLIDRELEVDVVTKQSSPTPSPSATELNLGLYGSQFHRESQGKSALPQGR